MSTLPTSARCVVIGAGIVGNSLVHHLARLGCDPVPFASGAACLAELERRIPTLVLMDLRMEGMQGDEACRRLKAHPNASRVPVVMLTGASAPAVVASIMLMACVSWRRPSSQRSGPRAAWTS